MVQAQYVHLFTMQMVKTVNCLSNQMFSLLHVLESQRLLQQIHYGS
jgi:hypothetical protein